MHLSEHSAFEQPLSAPEPYAPWYLLDLALRPEGLRELYTQASAPDYRLLYHGTPYEHLRKQGPLLIRANTRALQDCYHTLVHEGLAIALYGDELDHAGLEAHFTSLLRVAMEGGGRALFRFADPRTYESLGATLTAGQCTRLLGPVELMAGGSAGNHWQLRRGDHAPKPAEESMMLTRANLDGIGYWRRRILIESLANQKSLAAELVAHWFSQLEALGMDSERTLYEGTEMIADSGQSKPLGDSQLKQIKDKTAIGDTPLSSLEQMLVNNERKQSA